MTDSAVDAFIDGLADDLRPVRRLWSPWARASAWLAVVGAAAGVLASFSDLSDLAHRLTSVPDMWVAVLGSVLTTVLGAVATFQLSLPDASSRWALLPLPGLAVWIAGTGFGCARTWVIPGLHPASLEEARTCFMFITALSVPLSILTVAMVRRAFPLRPNLVAATGGFAGGGGGGPAGGGVAPPRPGGPAAATRLNFFHPYDVGVTDVAVHVVAIGLVILANRAVGGRLLTPRARRAKGDRT